MARGDIAYVDRPLYDYVQHGDAALGHQRANQGAVEHPLAQRMETIKKGGVLEGWGLVYYQHYRRLLLAADGAQACGSEISSQATGRRR